MIKMSSVVRNNYLSLLLLLLTGHVAMTVHTAAHIPVDQTICEFCAGHANPTHAIPPSTPELPLAVAIETGSDYSHPIPQLAGLISYQERAPPVHI
jgi:hypothetical protein